MKKFKYFDELILILIVIGSLISLYLFVTNINTISDILSNNSEKTLALKIMPFFTIGSTLLSIIRVNYFKNSKLWFFPIFVLSFLGTFIYGVTNLITKLRKGEGELHVNN